MLWKLQSSLPNLSWKIAYWGFHTKQVENSLLKTNQFSLTLFVIWLKKELQLCFYSAVCIIKVFHSVQTQFLWGVDGRLGKPQPIHAVQMLGWLLELILSKFLIAAFLQNQSHSSASTIAFSKFSLIKNHQKELWVLLNLNVCIYLLILKFIWFSIIMVKHVF